MMCCGSNVRMLAVIVMVFLSYAL